MTVEVNVKITWDGMSKDFANQSEKKMKRAIKEMVGASNVEIIEVNAWDEDEE